MMIKFRGERVSHRKMTRKSSLEKSNYGEGGSSSPPLHIRFVSRQNVNEVEGNQHCIRHEGERQINGVRQVADVSIWPGRGARIR